jgi:hypothetical protein
VPLVGADDILLQLKQGEVTMSIVDQTKDFSVPGLLL